MKVMIFGTGEDYQKYKEWFKNTEIIALLDNDIDKQGTILDGVEIFSPSVVKNKKFDFVYILSSYKREMRIQLTNLGVKERNIRDDFNLQEDFYHGYENNQLVVYGYDRQISSLIACDKVKKILLISYDLNLTGAGMALLYLAKVLKNIGYRVVVAAVFDGILKKEFLHLKIPIIIDINLQVAILADVNWIKKFSLVWVNTSQFYRLLLKRNFIQPVLWWIHEPKSFYKNIQVSILAKLNTKNLFIYAVSSMADNALKEYMPDINTNLLTFGIPDFYDNRQLQTNKVIFAVVGTVSKLKGYDIFLSAIKQTLKLHKNNVEFWIIGNHDTSFGKKILVQLSNIDEAKVFGQLNREEIKNVYKQISVLVCPSREETMSIVTVEAMMNCKPCIVSDGVTMSKFIENGSNGFVIPTENSQVLAEKMNWFIENRSIIEEMGIKARNVYLENFSMQLFENEVKKIMKEKLG
ncbi:glycosyltransferase family 4 protein [Pectinatus frisingensis]|uniref:glycosyltransferase family 4 protein n=1 Tax=Pectinatus frisingensis TaxID=865 RepID=UPI0018C72851|nr:glycosyltransferase family 4 protein [Pectinatus frisingensis]